MNERALYTDFKYYDDPDFFTKFQFAQQSYPNQAESAMWIVPRTVQCVMIIIAMSSIIISAGSILFGLTILFVIVNALIGLPTLKADANFQVKSVETWRPFDYVTRILQQKENAAELRSSGAGVKFLKTVVVVAERYRAVYYTYMKKILPFSTVQALVSPLQIACVLLYIILFVINGDVSKIGLYASLTAASATLASGLNGAYSSINTLVNSTLYGERIAAFFETKSEIEPIVEGKTLPPEGKYEVELKNVTFAYQNSSFCIENLNLHIKPGQRIAIVGENAAGKSTLTKLLLRLYDVLAGKILINGTNIKNYDIHALRLHIAIAFQDVRVLAMSLRDNLTVYREASDEKIMEVIQKLGLDGILSKANGDWNRMISREFAEHGIVLSGGEAQRIVLARLFLGEFGLLILDEPSSALDPTAEYQLMQTILDASNTATTIMVAHRLSTVRNFDQIYHMENGKIIESGTHEELMTARGKYFEMFSRQAENYQSNSVGVII